MKHWLRDFPTHPATVAVALIGVLSLVLIADVRLALGKVFPDGYDTYLWMLAALCGVAGAWGVGKRVTDYDYAAIKAGAPAPLPSAVTAESGSSVTVQREATPLP